MGVEQWDAVLAAAYRAGFILLELDENENPVRAYRSGSWPAVGDRPYGAVFTTGGKNDPRYSSAASGVNEPAESALRFGGFNHAPPRHPMPVLGWIG